MCLGKFEEKKDLGSTFSFTFSLRKITQSKSNYLLYKNEMLVMPNILSLTCICFNFASLILGTDKNIYQKVIYGYFYENIFQDKSSHMVFFFYITKFINLKVTHNLYF